jgi:hypothetical protein
MGDVSPNPASLKISARKHRTIMPENLKIYLLIAVVKKKLANLCGLILRVKTVSGDGGRFLELTRSVSHCRIVRRTCVELYRRLCRHFPFPYTAYKSSERVTHRYIDHSVDIQYISKQINQSSINLKRRRTINVLVL